MKSEDLAYLYSLTNEYRSIRYDLRNMQAFAASLGNPQEGFESVLIAGTNGKGSVGKMISAMMPSAGFYSSPHLVRLNERILIGESEISDADLEAVFGQVRSAAASAKNLLYPPTYFEIVTAMAFVYFRERVKYAVLEVGLGGRLDATNIVKQRVSVITSIGLDHQPLLGSTLEAIAAEKAGIIKGTEPVVVGPDVNYAVVGERAGDHLVTTRDVWRESRAIGGGYFEVDVRTPVREYTSVRLGLPGRHQIDNAIVAIRAAEYLDLAADAIKSGLELARWPGRLQRIAGHPAFLLDGAHNTHAVRRLVSFLEEFYPAGVWMIFGAMADKQCEEMIRMLFPRVRFWILTRPQNTRARDPQELAGQLCGSVVQSDVKSAIAFARVNAPDGMTVVVCGSLYLIGEALAVLD